MPAVIVAFAAEEAYVAVSEYAAFDLGAGAVGSTLLGGIAATIAAGVTARALGLNAGPSEFRPSTPQGALVDVVGTYSGIPVVYGSRRIGGVRVLTESQSTVTTRGEETFLVTDTLTTYRVVNAAVFTGDVGVIYATQDTDGGQTNTFFVNVPGAPAAGQYSASGTGLYTFNAADAGKSLIIEYNYQQSNDRLHCVIIWGMGEIGAVKQVYLDDVPITDARFNGLAYYENYVGTDTQAASAALISALNGKWTAAHQLRGLAYSYVRLDWSESAFPRGKPTITADVQGKKVFDPRSGLTAYSNNPWLCIRDYLTNVRYGCRVPAAMIDDAAMTAEANYAEQRVTAPTFAGSITAVDPALDTIRFSLAPGFGPGDGIQIASTGTLPSPLAAATTYYVIPTADPPGAPTQSGTLPSGTTFKLATSAANAMAGTAIDLTAAGSGAVTTSFQDLQRYMCDGVLDIDRTRLDNLRGLLSSCRGFLVFSGGLYKAKSEAVSSPVSLVLTEDNIIGGWSVQLPQRRGRFNRMRANFFDAANLWQSNVVIQDSTVYRAADGGAVFEGALDAPFTTNVYRANQLAMMALKQSRFGMGVSLRATIAALQLEVGDVVPITHATPGWVAQNFRVGGMQLLDNDEIAITLTQYDPSVYTLDSLPFVNPPPATRLPDPFRRFPPGAPVITETLYATTGSAGVKSRATVTWTESPDIYVRNGGYYQLEVSPAGLGNWTVYSRVRELLYVFNDMAAGIYDFRITAVNTLGIKGPYAQTTKELLGLTAPPADPSGFSVIKSAGFALASWVLSPDLDVQINGIAVIRHSPLTTGATWNDGVILDEFPGGKVEGQVPLITGTYMMKFIDSSGNYSVNFASFVATEGMVSGFTIVGTTTQQTAFIGAKTNVANVGSAIQLDGTTLIDSMVTNVDSWPFLDGLGGISATGSYAFDTYLDHTTVATRRLEADIKALSFDTGDFIDARLDPIDSWGPFDGAVINDCDVTLYYASTNDDPAGAPTWGPWTPFFVADVTARAEKFKLDFASGSSNHNISVSILAVDAKIPT